MVQMSELCWTGFLLDFLNVERRQTRCLVAATIMSPRDELMSLSFSGVNTLFETENANVWKRGSTLYQLKVVWYNYSNQLLMPISCRPDKVLTVSDECCGANTSRTVDAIKSFRTECKQVQSTMRDLSSRIRSAKEGTFLAEAAHKVVSSTRSGSEYAITQLLRRAMSD